MKKNEDKYKLLSYLNKYFITKMKKYIISTVVLFVSILTISSVHGLLNENFSFPIQAGICDIIGVARATNTCSNGVVLAVDNYWRGNPGTNSLYVVMETNFPPVTNTPTVFFVSKNHEHPKNCEERDTIYDYASGSKYVYIFKGYKWYCQCIPIETGLRFYHDEYSWFHVNETNANLVTFASNLVFSTQSQNTNLFYQTIRDGYNLNPKNSKINEDSFFAFFYSEYYLTTNFIIEVWSDPLLKGFPRSSLRDHYYQKSKIILQNP